MVKISPHKILTIEAINSAEYKEIEENNFFTLWGKIKNIAFSRVKIAGFITNTYISPDRKYGFIRIDDGTGSIIVKYFKDALTINNFEKGDLVVVFGRVSKYNEEVQIINETTQKLENMNYFLLHRLECIKEEKFYNKLIEDVNLKGYAGEEGKKYILSRYSLHPIEVEVLLNITSVATSKEPQNIQKEEVKAQILEYLRSQEDSKAEYSQIINDLPYGEDIIEQAIVDLLSEGNCYEPQPGVIKLL